ncbi:MAG: endonuclease III domain-containing protein [Thermoguttaceae bacterium]|nr:endonuclease III domain-containing protein [Thermoguttaceae bacterium]
MLNKLYNDLLAFYPMKPWWPGESALETVIGTILTQNTSWKGVLKSIENLKNARKLDLDALLETPDEELAELIRPSGYLNLKTRRLKNLLRFIKTRYGTVEAMRNVPGNQLREELLSVNGVGRETADSILLYGLGKPSFVVDAYTRRVLDRHGLMPGKTSYDEIRSAFEHTIPQDVALYAHYHAMFVELCKTFCLKNHPKCGECPLGSQMRTLK